jgi:hypothetical protein
MAKKTQTQKELETMAAKKAAEVARYNILLEIASTNLGLGTLETRNSDSLDFREQAVWSIKHALIAAYEAGRAAASK